MSLTFSQSVRIDCIRDGERIELSATDDERAAIAQRLGLAALDRLEAHASLERAGAVIRSSGRLQASLTQHCVVTGDPIASLVDEAFEFLFEPDPGAGLAESEIELGADDCDTVFYDGGAIPLGDALADTLALSLEPYPRSAGAEVALREAGVLSEGEAGPFAALAALKGKSGSEA